ncbi:hypothetical protein Goklo_025025 [Gossypium klotzschianum]|uniref:Uncharacterized protein n=1 Tax=Gossypium klotzschianum TaxID=34286 RepID=A0A7J8W852_9ROSI|nr:hypothetical protein [Gossypium klotzschianum]
MPRRRLGISCAILRNKALFGSMFVHLTS